MKIKQEKRVASYQAAQRSPADAPPLPTTDGTASHCKSDPTTLNLTQSHLFLLSIHVSMEQILPVCLLDARCCTQSTDTAAVIPEAHETLSGLEEENKTDLFIHLL